jgi:hypothetical protein
VMSTVATARAYGAGCSAVLIDLRPAAHLRQIGALLRRGADAEAALGAALGIPAWHYSY